jgi:hypothetical protein
LCCPPSRIPRAPRWPVDGVLTNRYWNPLSASSRASEGQIRARSHCHAFAAKPFLQSGVHSDEGARHEQHCRLLVTSTGFDQLLTNARASRSGPRWGLWHADHALCLKMDVSSSDFCIAPRNLRLGGRDLYRRRLLWTTSHDGFKSLSSPACGLCALGPWPLAHIPIYLWHGQDTKANAWALR